MSPRRVPRPAPSSEELPVDFHGHRLLKVLGHGCLVDAYLAEICPDSRSSLPPFICIKIITNPYKMYTKESAREELVYQRNLLSRIDHPFIIKGFPHALPDEVENAMATDLAVCTLEALQKAINPDKDYKANMLPLVVVKYFASQLFLALAHLHKHKTRWGDPKQANAVIMKDFTLRLIDVGDKEAKPEKTFVDFCYTAAIINNMGTSSSEQFVQQQPPFYHDLVKRFEDELEPSLHSLLGKLLELKPFEELLNHPYWTESIDGDPATSINLVNSGLTAVYNMRESAWKALPQHLREWFKDQGGRDPTTFAVIEYPTRFVQVSDSSASVGPTGFSDSFTSFPADFRGYKLLKLLGRGCHTDAYLAETPADSGFPSLICIKIITTSRSANWHNDVLAKQELKYQGELLKMAEHPLIVKCFGQLLATVDYAIATEAGVCSLEQMQGYFDLKGLWRTNILPAVTVKYIAAQLFVGISYLHQQGIVWGGAKQANVAIMQDFTLRIIDVGRSSAANAERIGRDFDFVVGMIINIVTSCDDDCMNSVNPYEDLLDRFRGEMSSTLHDLLCRLLQEEPYEALLSHAYWSVRVDEDPDTSVNLIQDKNEIVKALVPLRKAAWKALPEHVREKFIQEAEHFGKVEL